MMGVACSPAFSEMHHVHHTHECEVTWHVPHYRHAPIPKARWCASMPCPCRTGSCPRAVHDHLITCHRRRTLGMHSLSFQTGACYIYRSLWEMPWLLTWLCRGVQGGIMHVDHVACGLCTLC